MSVSSSRHIAVACVEHQTMSGWRVVIYDVLWELVDIFWQVHC